MNYSNLLNKLQKEVKNIETAKRKKRWKPHQKIMVDYINGSSKQAILIDNETKIILAEGDKNKGFMHILLGHYKNNDLETMDIINIFEIYIRGIKLASKGVSNNYLTVYMTLKNNKEFRLVLNPINDNSLVVTAYRKS